MLHIPHDKAVVQGFFIRCQCGFAVIAFFLGGNDRLRRKARRFHAQVHASDGIAKVHYKCCRVTGNKDTVPVQLRDHVIAALCDQVRAVFLQSSTHQIIPDRRMLFQTLDHVAGRNAAVADITDRRNNAHRHTFLIRVQETSADSAACHITGDQPCNALVRSDAKPLIDLLFSKIDDFLDAYSYLPGIQFFLKSQSLRQQGVDTVRQKDAVSEHLFFSGFDADRLAALVCEHFVYANARNEHGAFFLSLLHQPGIEMRAQNRVADILRIPQRLTGKLDGRGVLPRHEGNLLPDDLALHRRLFAEIREYLFNAVRIHSSAGHVFAAGLLRSLNDEHFQPCLRQNAGGNATC